MKMREDQKSNPQGDAVGEVVAIINDQRSAVSLFYFGWNEFELTHQIEADFYFGSVNGQCLHSCLVIVDIILQQRVIHNNEDDDDDDEPVNGITLWAAIAFTEGEEEREKRKW